MKTTTTAPPHTLAGVRRPRAGAGTPSPAPAPAATASEPVIVPSPVTLTDRHAWITAQGDRTEHAVTDTYQQVAKVLHGVFIPLCREFFTSAWMDAAPAARCPECEALALARVNAPRCTAARVSVRDQRPRRPLSPFRARS